MSKVYQANSAIRLYSEVLKTNSLRRLNNGEVAKKLQNAQRMIWALGDSTSKIKNKLLAHNEDKIRQCSDFNHDALRPEVNHYLKEVAINAGTLGETKFKELTVNSNEEGVEIANTNRPSRFHSKNHEFLQIFNKTPHVLSHMFSKSSLTSQVQLSHMFSTCAACNNKTCPRIMPPKSLICEPEVKLPKCPKPEGFKWPCCPKITLCGCDPPHPRSQTMDCDKGPKPKFPFSKNPQYICPAFSECLRNTELIKERPHECCMQKKPCDSFLNGPVKPFITTIERQELSLGQNYWTGRKEQKCNYHTSVINRSNRANLFKRPQWKFITALGGPEMSLVEKGKKCAYHTTALRMDKEGCTSCNKAACETCFEPAEGFCCPKKKIKEETEKVCMKINCIPGNRKKEKFVTPCSLDECEKICLPCCQPARDPPSCDDRAVFKKVCKRKSNPSPSFSECGTGNIKTEICECLITIKPKCKSGSKVDASPESNS